LPSRAAQSTPRQSGEQIPELAPSKVNLDSGLRFRSAIQRSSPLPPSMGTMARLSSGDSRIAGLPCGKSLLTVCNFFPYDLTRPVRGPWTRRARTPERPYRRRKTHRQVHCPDFLRVRPRETLLTDHVPVRRHHFHAAVRAEEIRSPFRCDLYRALVYVR
jgi:hypothetical protein